MACFWDAGKMACKIDMLISKARIGANTVRSFLRSQTGVVSNSHCFVEESPRSCLTSSALIGSKADRRWFCAAMKVGGMESLVTSRIDSLM